MSGGPEGCEGVLRRAGVFKGAGGLRGLVEADEFWSGQPYGTRLYYGEGALDYLHRDVLRAAVRALDEASVGYLGPSIRPQQGEAEPRPRSSTRIKSE